MIDLNEAQRVWDMATGHASASVYSDTDQELNDVHFQQFARNHWREMLSELRSMREAVHILTGEAKQSLTERDEVLSILRALFMEQKDPPLPRRKTQWRSVMASTEDILDKYGVDS